MRWTHAGPTDKVLARRLVFPAQQLAADPTVPEGQRLRREPREGFPGKGSAYGKAQRC